MDGTRDLVRRLARVLDVAETVVRVLLAGPEPEKVLSETALLLLFAARVDESHRQLHRRIRTLAKQLVPYARSERVLAGITLTPALAREYAAAHVCLSELSFPDPTFDEVLARSLASGRCSGGSGCRTTELDLEWLAAIAQNGRRRAPDSALAAATTAGLGLDPLGPRATTCTPSRTRCST